MRTEYANFLSHSHGLSIQIVGGFFVPPVGVIDGSDPTAVGFLLMFCVIAKIPEAIRAGRSVKISKGDFSAEIDPTE